MKLTTMVRPKISSVTWVSYEKKIRLMSSCSNAFIVGWKNYQKLAVADHAKSKSHMKAYQLYFYSQWVPLEKRAKSFWPNSGNEGIVPGFSNNDPKDLPVMKRKFGVAYFVTDDELPFSKYKEIPSLEKHNVQMWDSYISDTACTDFIDFIGLDLEDQLHSKRLGES